MRPRLAAALSFGWLLVWTFAAVAQEPQLRRLKGHASAVRDVAITADGKMIVSAGVDGTLRLWDRLNGQLLRTLPAHDGAILTFELSPDGNSVAIADAKGWVKLLNLPRPYPLAELVGFPQAPDHLIVTRDGQHIVTGDGSEVLRLFHLANKQQVREFGGAAGGTIDIGLASDGEQLVATSGDGHLRGWKFADGQPSGSVLVPSPSQLAASRSGSNIALAGEDGVLRLVSWPPVAATPLTSHGDQVSGVAISADGKAVLSGGFDQQVLLHPEGAAPKTFSGAGSRVMSVALNPDGSLAAAGTENGLVPLWKTADGTIAGVLAGHAGPIADVAFHPQRPLIASAGADGTVVVWRPIQAPLAWAAHPQPATVLAVSGDGTQAVSAGADKSVRIWNTADGQAIAAWENLAQPVTAATFAADGKRVILGDEGGVLALRSIADGHTEWSMPAHPGPIADVARLAGGKLATAGVDGQVKLWDLASIGRPETLAFGMKTTAILSWSDGAVVAGQADGKLQFADFESRKTLGQADLFATAVSALSASGDGRLLFAGSDGGEVAVLQSADRTVQSRFPAHASKVRAIAVQPQGSQFATAGDDGAVRIWNLPLPPRDLRAHESAVTVVTVSPDGKQAASGDAGGALHRWNLPDATPLALVAGGKAALTAAAYRRDGQELASGDADGIIRLIAAGEGTELGTIGAHEGKITGISFHPSGTQLLSGGADGVLRLWQLPLTPPKKIAEAEDAVKAVAVTGDGNAAIIATGDKQLSLIDLGTGQQRAAIQAPAVVTSVAISPDNSQLAFVTAEGSLHLATMADGKVMAEVGAHAGASTAVAFRPQGGQIATAGNDGQLRLWEVPATQREFSDHTARIAAAAVSPNGQWLATASADKTVRLWNLADGTASWTLGHAEGVSAISWKPDSTQVAAAAGTVVQVWNTADGQAALTLDKHVGPVTAIAFAADGASLYATGKRMAIQHWNLADGKLLRSLGEGDEAATTLTLVAGGSQLVASSEAGQVTLWNLASGTFRTIDHGSEAAAVAASSDGRWLAIADLKAGIELYDLTDGALAHRIAAEQVRCLGFSGDHQTLAAGATDGTVRIWDLQGKLQEFIPSSSGRNVPTAVTFLPDHRQIAIGYEKGLVRIPRRALVRTVSVANSPVTAVAWSADGQFVVTGDEEKTIKQFSAADGTLVRQFSGQAGVPRCVLVTRDGSKVLSGCDDRSLRAWNFSDGSLTATMLLKESPKGLAASPDGSRIAVADERQVTMWDLATQRVSERFGLASTAVVMLPDGKQLLVGDVAGATYRLTLANVAMAPAHTGGISGSTFSQDGQRWLSVGHDKSVKSWDAAGKPQATLGACEGIPTVVALRSDGLQMAVAGQDRQIYVWRLDNNQLERKIAAGSQVSGLAYHPSQPKLVAVCADGLLRIFDTADGGLLETVSAPKGTCAAFAGDALLAGHADHELRIYAPSLVRKLAGHQGTARALAYSADGATLFSGGEDKTVRQWNVADGAALRTVATAGDAITGLALSDDGSRILIAGADKALRVHNVADGAAVATYNSPTPIRLLATGAGNRWLATSGDDGSISIWDATTGAIRETLAGLSGPAAGLAISTDGQHVLAVGKDGLQAWPLACRGQFAADAAKVYDLAITPDGKHFITCGEDKLVKLWDAQGQLVRPFLGSTYAPRNIAVRSDGKQILAGGDVTQTQTQLLAWNLEDGQTQFTMALPAPIVEAVYLDEGRIAVACADQKLRVLSTVDGKLIEERPLAAAASAMAALGSEETTAGSALIVSAADNQLYRLEPSRLRVIAAHEGGATAVAWSGEGNELFTAGADKLIRQWNAVTGEPLGTLSAAPAAVVDLAVSADRLRVIASGDDQKLRIWDLSGGQSNRGETLPAMRDIAHPTPIRSLTCSASGGRIITGGEDGLVRVWDAASGKEVERFAGHTGPVLALAADNAGTLVASGGADKTVRKSTTLVASVASTGEGASTACAFSPDGALVFVATDAGKLAAWSADGLSWQRDYAGASRTVRAIAVSRPEDQAAVKAAGDLVAAGGDDMHLRVWSASEGTLLAEVMTHAPIASLQFARQGRLLIAGGSDGILRHYGLSRSEGKLTLELSLQARGHVGAIRRLAVPADDGLAISVAADGKVLSWRLAESSPRWQRELGREPIGALAFRPDGQTLVTGGFDGVLRELSMADGSTVNQWRHEGGVLALAFRPDGQELASAGRDGTIRLWNAERGEAARLAVAPAGAVQAMEWSADNALLQVAGRNRLWQTLERSSFGKESLPPPRQAEGHNHPVVALRYSANRQRVATLDDSGKLFVWDAAAGTSLFHQQLDVTAAYDLAWSPDASEIVLATSDSGVLRVTVPVAAR